MNKEHLKGIFGEIYTAIIMIFKGYRVLKWRYKSKIGEIDLIFIKKRTIVFMEVKTRYGTNLDVDSSKVVTSVQMDRIRRSCECFIKKNEKYHHYSYNISVSVVTSIFKTPLIYNID